MSIKITTSSFISRIAVLMTCHNRREKTLTCLQALFAQRLPPLVSLVVYLVDDGSTDGTGDAVQEQFPNVEVLRENGNLYWCGGMRVAWTEAMKGDYDAYLWLNDDTLLLNGAIEVILSTAHEIRNTEGRDGIVVGSCKDPHTGVHTYGGYVKRDKSSCLPDMPLPPGNKVLPCDTINANLVLIPRAVFVSIGNFSSEYTHAFGDVDYGMRARQKGIPIYVAPGHLALCAYNNRVRPWTDPSVPIKKRWADMKGPLGLPPKQWYIYVKRHTGVMWPIYFLKPIVRLILPHLWNQR
jgi:GT2 family glycosyltransferase